MTGVQTCALPIFKKLERVTQNLLRLTDIVQQLDQQLSSTRNQAAKAAKYREVSEELKKVWLGLVADDFRHFNRELGSLDAKLKAHVKNVVVIYLENRSFNNLFADFPGLAQPLSALPAGAAVQKDRDGSPLPELPKIWEIGRAHV